MDWILEIKNRVATLTLNRLDTKNSLGRETLPELSQICKEIAQMPEVCAVVVQGAGNTFCSGADLRDMFTIWNKPEPEITAYFADALKVFQELGDLEKPTIAKIDGYCIAGGILLAAFCDFRIATDRAIFALTEARRSIMIFMLTQQLKRLCGLANAKEMTLLAEKFDAHQAQKYGLLNEICKPENLETTVKKWTDKFQNLPTLAVGKNKAVLNMEASDYDTLVKEVEAQKILIKSEDFQEAAQSFMQKRVPQFKGK